MAKKWVLLRPVAKTYLVENQAVFQEMLEKIAREPLDEAKLTKDAKDNRVELLVIKAGKRWTTSTSYPEIRNLTENAEKIGSLMFKKHEGKYYVTAQQNNHYASVTSKIMNLIVFPNWLAYWPWFAVLMVLFTSYSILKALLNPINLAIQSAEKLSRGELNYQIEKHPNTELSALTRSLNLMARNLNQLFSAQNDLLLAVSHELRSPLARMKVSLAMLEQSDTATELSQDINHIDDLIAQILEGERLKRGHAILDIKSFYFPKLIDDLLAEPAFQNQTILKSDIPEIVVDIDMGRIMFALRNLLKNAIEHSPDNVPVELLVEEQGAFVTIKVQDSGPGIPEALLERVFEPFFRVESIQNRSFNGVGLGLFLCKRIVEAHQGELTANNPSEGGGEFTVRLPL